MKNTFFFHSSYFYYLIPFRMECKSKTYFSNEGDKEFVRIKCMEFQLN